MRPPMLITLLFALIVLALVAVPAHLSAQFNPPVTIFPPGPVVITLTPPATPTLEPGTCFQPLPLGIGDQIGIRPGVNIRNLPSASGAVVNYFDLPVAAFITEGPVCADGYNWWRVRGIGTPGWVAEGRPGFYFVSLITDASAPEVCPPAQDIRIGERVRLFSGLRVRETPGSDSLVITIAPYQSLLTVVGGPVCRDDLNYWQVEVPYGDSGQLVRGWITEGPVYDYYLEPETRPLSATPECLPPANFRPGDRLVVVSTGGAVRSLRSAPAENAPLIATLIGGLQLTLIEGPICRDNFNWWRVQVIGGSSDPIGWLAEGTPRDPFIERLPVPRRPY